MIEESYLTAYHIMDRFDVHDIVVSKYNIDVEVKYEMEEEALIEYLEDKSWTYEGNHMKGTGHGRLTVFAFVL